MNDLWQQFEAWLCAHWPGGLAALNPPATDEEIAALEAALGARLPRDFVDCLRIHNGQSGAVAATGGVFGDSEFLSTAAILAQWTTWKELLDAGTFDGEDFEAEPQEGVRGDWWNAGWIPFTQNGFGDGLCIDLAPDTGGRAGQIIEMWHDMGDRDILAESFDAWFRRYVAAVVAGEYRYSEDVAGLRHRDDA